MPAVNNYLIKLFADKWKIMDKFKNTIGIYVAPAWSPFRKKDILALERVRRRAKKLVRQFKNLSFKERLLKLKLTTL